ncbi:unnamed protein product [Cyclocybe aegerita]|uniref:Uncharacterized protein n=1 Tax=Cyclocybe aegerita TaxID=1973307 RepID=A0A8S0VQM0_CYCAE|nr:unnamed protein product [Cyclocybe aegerita]
MVLNYQRETIAHWHGDSGGAEFCGNKYPEMHTTASSSTAVLHHRGASKNLRRRWRPVFTAAAKVIRELQESPNAADAWRRERLDWLKVWNERVDNTLEFLYTAANSRGIPHQVTRNLAQFTARERGRFFQKVHQLPRWKPNQTFPATPKPISSKEKAKLEKKQKYEEFTKNADGALEEVIRMAEASANLTLARNKVAILRWSPRK